MPDWRDDIRHTVEDMAASAVETLTGASAPSADDVHGWISGLLDAIVNGDSSAATALLESLASVMSADEVAMALVIEATARDDSAVRDVIHFVLDRSMTSVSSIVAGALSLTMPERDTVMTILLRVLSANGWLDLGALLGAFRNRPSVLDALIGQLFRVGLAQWSDVRSLLELPERVAANVEEGGLLFDALFAALTRVATAAQQITALATAVAHWLIDAPLADAVSVHPGVAAHLNDLDVFRVTRRAALTGSAIASLSAASPGAHAAALPFLEALVRALEAAGEAGQRALGMINTIPAVFFLLLPAMLLVAVAIPMRFIEWLGQDVKTLRQHDRDLKIKVLPAPSDVKGAECKYMIFSDLHRDSPDDTVAKHLFDVSHFSANREMYVRALQYCLDEGYTVIENGDCEELWYRPKLVGTFAARASDVVANHPGVYTKLAELHRAHRYFRTRGNHDNWWALAPGRTGPLQAEIAPPDTDAFVIWDGLVIPDVRTMELDIPIDPKEWPASETELIQFLLDRIPVGLSPLRYKERKPMFVLHGHQVDFWNCDEHHFLGLAITNAIGVPADGVDALPYYLKGIDMDGNPVRKFGDWFAVRSPWDNWVPDDQAKTFARRIEIMPETERKLQDSVSFSETLAASLSLFLRYQEGPVRDFCETPGVKVQIAMGHTHNPQSRPYLNLTDPPLGLLPDDVKTLIDWVKAPYFNSGTCGWWENVMWALEITPHGQPRLVYWDADCFKPHVMTWELHNLDVPNAADVQALIARLKVMLNSLGNTASAPAAPPVIPQSFSLAWEGASGSADFDLSALDPVRQYAAAAWAQLAQLKNTACTLGGGTITMKIDLRNLPIGETRASELAKSHMTARQSPEHMFETWTKVLDCVPGKKLNAEKLRRLSAVLLYIAFAHSSGLLHNVGLMLFFASHGDQEVMVSRPAYATLAISLGPAKRHAPASRWGQLKP